MTYINIINFFFFVLFKIIENFSFLSTKNYLKKIRKKNIFLEKNLKKIENFFRKKNPKKIVFFRKQSEKQKSLNIHSMKNIT